MAKRCDMCFQLKDPLQRVIQSMPAMVCKACGYKIGQVTSFLEYHGGTLAYQPPLTKETPPDPPQDPSEVPEAPGSKKKGRSRSKTG